MHNNNNQLHTAQCSQLPHRHLRSQSSVIRQLGGSSALVRVWKRYLWSSEASLDDIAVSWRIFTTLAAHDAINRLTNDPEWSLLLKNNVDSVRTLQRHICARLENASWRVWFEKRSNQLDSAVRQRSQLSGDNNLIVKSPHSPGSDSSCSNNRSASTQGFAAVSGFRPPSSIQQQFDNKKSNGNNAAAQTLNRCRSEPNIIQLPHMHKRQQIKVTKWLSQYILTSLRSIPQTGVAAATGDARLLSTNQSKSLGSSSRLTAAGSSLSPDSVVFIPERQQAVAKQPPGSSNDKSNIFDIPQSGTYSKYRYVVRIPQRSLLTKIIKESTEDMSSCCVTADKSIGSATTSGNSSIADINNRPPSMEKDRHQSHCSLASSSRRSASSLLSQQAYNINASTSQLSLRKSSREDINVRSTKSTIAEFPGNVSKTTGGVSKSTSGITSSLKYRNTDTVPIGASEATVTVIPGNIHRKDQSHQHIIQLSSNQGRGDMASNIRQDEPNQSSLQTHQPPTNRQADLSQRFFEQSPSICASEVAKHNSEADCWIIVHGKVYDVTKFLSEHPGGKKPLLKAAGTDASKQFDAFHSASVLEKFGPALYIGELGEEKPIADNSAGEMDASSFGDLLPFGDPMWYADFQSPYYSESHRKVRAVMREFVDKEITPYCFEWDEAKQVPKSLYTKCASMGIMAALCVTGETDVISEYNGPTVAGVPLDKFDAFHEFIVCDELSRCGSGGVLWAVIGGLGIGLPPIIKFGSKSLRDRVVPDCLSGHKTICLAITEPYAGSDVANLQCEARESDDGQHYIVNGEKKWITNGAWADYFTVAVRTGDAGMGGLSLLLIERSMPGVKTRRMDCSGVWSSGTGYITFEDVAVPKANLIGKENSGFKYIMYNFNHERMGIAIQSTRFARVCYEDALKYAHKRKTFGKRLVDHPVIRNKLAHMARKIEATHAWMEALIYQTITLPKEQQMLRLGGPIALLKAQSTQTFEFCAREAAQIFGGLAYSRGGQGERVERLYREVRAYAIPGGSEEIMLDLGMRQSIKVAQMQGAKL